MARKRGGRKTSVELAREALAEPGPGLANPPLPAPLVARGMEEVINLAGKNLEYETHEKTRKSRKLSCISRPLWL